MANISKIKIDETVYNINAVTLGGNDSSHFYEAISRSANTVLAAPDGSDGVASFRKLLANDLPTHMHVLDNILDLHADWDSILKQLPPSFVASSFSTELIVSLSGYSKATSIAALASTDSLNTALGKLEYKADHIINNYLPLGGGTITGTLWIKRDPSAIGFSSPSGSVMGWIGMQDGTPIIYGTDSSTRSVIYHQGNLTKSTLGLGNVDNTADADKSVKYANSAGYSKALEYNSFSLVTNTTNAGHIEYSYNVYNTTANLFPVTNNANGVLTLNTHGGNYAHQLGFSSDNRLYHRAFLDSSDAAISWNKIAFTSDLSSYLPLGGGSMASGARIGASEGPLYIGNSSNANWVYLQDVASAAGTAKWNIYTSGAATFLTVTAVTFTGNLSGTASYIKDSANGTNIAVRWGGNWETVPDGLCGYKGYNIVPVLASILSVNYANSAGSVAWGNVSGKPDLATRWPTWSEVTGKPTIPTIPNLSISTSGSGTYVSNVTVSGHTITITKGTPPNTDTNTWRPVVNNLTSTATDQSLSAALGKVLNDKFAGYLPLTGGTVSGNITATGFYEGSDIRLKSNIEELDSSNADKLRLVQFDWLKDGKRGYGVIALEIEPYYPEIVFTDTDGFKKVNYDLVAMIKIKLLEDEIKHLKQILQNSGISIF